MPKHFPPSVPTELIEQKIYLIRGHKVMLDADLAELYDVTTGNLNSPFAATRSDFRKTLCFDSARKKASLCHCKMQEQKAAAVVALHPMLSPSRAPCFPAFSIVSAPLK